MKHQVASGACTKFVRPQFSPLPPKDKVGPRSDDIKSLLDLIEFNASSNPESVFCIQAQIFRKGQGTEAHAPSYSGVSITFAQLYIAVLKCADWVKCTMRYPPTFQDAQTKSPVALYLESDVGLFIHLMALQLLDIPVLLVSVRLSLESVQHLLRETGSAMVFASKRTSSLLANHIDATVNIKIVQPYSSFLMSSPSQARKSVSAGWTTFNDEEMPEDRPETTPRKRLILHSSGTTGLPKPIFLTNRYLLGYAACHQFSEDENTDWVNLSTLPLYHGFGFLAPALSLSLGMTCCFPPSSLIPAGQSTFDLLNTFNCQSLMTVPSIVDDLFGIESAGKRLATLEFLAVGGGALRLDQGLRLEASDVKLLNHYGVTEIGAISPIFRPDANYNWRYLRMRRDLDLELQPIQGSSRFLLAGHPIGWKEHVEIQDEIEMNHECASGQIEIRILGRTDDVIVLKTGEKIMPQRLEAALIADTSVRTAVCLGQGSFELVILVEPANYTLDGNGGIEAEWKNRLQDHLWKMTTAINASLDRHARVSSREAIIIKPVGKAIPRSDKGSISRRLVHEVFDSEIQAAYAAMDNVLSEKLNLEDVEGSVQSILKMVTVGYRDQEPDQDFFECGMDSLQAVRLARLLNAAVQRCTMAEPIENQSERITVEFIYRYPSFTALTTALSNRIAVKADMAESFDCAFDRISEVEALCQKFVDGIVSRTEISPQVIITNFKVVLMTGATGNLGAHLLSQLVDDMSVVKIICLYRATTTEADALPRLQAAVRSAGLTIHSAGWRKINFVQDVHFLRMNEQYSETQHDVKCGSRAFIQDEGLLFAQIAREITHIAHLAWPMEFQRTAASFAPHLQMVEALIRLSRLAHSIIGHRASRPVRFIFASSIAVVRRYNETEVKSERTSGIAIPERFVNDPSVPAPMGYAEAKWVCERMLQQAAEGCGNDVEAAVIRIGQLSGPESTGGAWKTSEHIPALIRASQKMGALPSLDGTISWLPVDRAARSLHEIMFSSGKLPSILHLENPARQSAAEIMAIVANELGMVGKALMPFEEWQHNAEQLGLIKSLSEFLSHHFRPMALGSVSLDTTVARSISKILRGSDALSERLIVEYVRRWREQGLFS